MVRYIKHYERMRKNPDVSVTHINRNIYNVFRETDGIDLGNYNDKAMFRFGFSKTQLDKVRKEGTTNFCRATSDKHWNITKKRINV